MIKNNTRDSATYRNMTIDGDAWKDRELDTYMSILDMYDAAELFTKDLYEEYAAKVSESAEIDVERKETVFTVDEIDEKPEQEIIDNIFSEEIKLSKVQEYGVRENNYVYLSWMIVILLLVICICILIKINISRNKRRKQYAAEINMEN